MEHRQKEPTTADSAADHMIDALAALGQHLLELQSSVADLAPGSHDDPVAASILQESCEHVAEMHLRAWSNATGFRTATARGPSPAAQASELPAE